MRRWYRLVAGDAADHGRARELAALRLDEVLPQGDAAWLDTHLGRCQACRSIAGEYEAQRAALRALRVDQPTPPRDLWARTAAAMDAGGRRARPRTRLTGSVQLAPVAGLLVIAIVVGAGLLNGTSLLPPSGGTGDGTAAAATPIALAAGELQVITRDANGQVEIRSRQVNELCPVGVDSCGASTALDVTQSTNLDVSRSVTGDGSAGLDAIISPDRDRLIVVDRGNGPQSIYVLPITAATTPPDVLPPPRTQLPAPSPTETPTTPGRTAKPAPTSTPPQATATVRASPSESAVSPSPTGTAATPAAPTPTASEPASPPTSAVPGTPSPEPPSGQPSPSDQAPGSPSPSAGPDETGSPDPTPTVEVTPGPNGAIEIARDVTLVGASPAYSPDGRQLAFSARPADGSTGPDVYVWQTGDATAAAVTVDHGSVFAGWLGDQILASRVIAGVPQTVTIAPSSGAAEAVGAAPMWLPVVAPDGNVAVWWDGTVRLAADGRSWVPDAGRLILAPWPNDGGDVQVLATSPLVDWDVRWDETRSVLAVWLRTSDTTAVGQLSLYPIDPTTDLADVARPTLADAPAYSGFSLRAGRLVWAAPDGTGESTVQVLAWSGETVGRLALPGLSGTSVIR